MTIGVGPAPGTPSRVSQNGVSSRHRVMWECDLQAHSDHWRPAMYAILAVPAALIVAAVIDARAGAVHAAPWCANYVAGTGTNCGFHTYEQCRDTVRGIGGSCTPNLWEPPSRPPFPGRKDRRSQ